MIEASVEKSYKSSGFRLLAEIADSGLICLTGSNGSGKSTLLGIIAGTLRPDAGAVVLNLRNITKAPIEKRKVVLVTPDSFLPNVKVQRHLSWGIKSKSSAEQLISELKEKLLKNVVDVSVGKLSLGNKEKVALVTALLSKPEAILVDEAFSNLDNREEFIRIYKEYTAKLKIDVIFSTQLREDAGLADHHYRIEAGAVSRIF